MKRKIALTMIVAILLVMEVAVVKVDKVKAVTRNITLYGEATLGWGFTSTSITSPGPQLSFDLGDVVNMTLISQDGLPHLLFIDYNGNKSPDLGEPKSPQFTGTINYQFIVNQTGAYTYYCYIHPLVMFGNTSIVPEFPTLLIVPLFMTATLVAVIAYRRRH
jgi:plastocyanin